MLVFELSGASMTMSTGVNAGNNTAFSGIAVGAAAGCAGSSVRPASGHATAIAAAHNSAIDDFAPIEGRDNVDLRSTQANKSLAFPGCAT
jgi:hypothetical protein